MSRIRGLVAGLALSAASLLLTLGALELALRSGWFEARAHRSTAIVDRATNNPREPNFRLEGPEPEAKSDQFRVVVVGDSFAWGDGVYAEDAFPFRLERRLQQLSRGTRFEVVNFSRPGWGTVQESKSLERWIDRLQPDLLLLAFVLNDPEPLRRDQRLELLAPAERRAPEAGLSSWLLERSKLYGLVWNRLENRRQHRALSDYYRSLFSGEHWEACLQALRRIGRMSRERGVPLVVVVFPVFDGPMDEDYAYADEHLRIRTEAEALGLPVLDLLESYRGIEGRRLAVTPSTDPHPNELAHRVAADGILEYLVRRDLVPPVRYKLFRQQLRATPRQEPDAEDPT